MVADIPKHIAIVMDGNGRWAQGRGHPRVFGHVRGSSRVKEVVKEANRLGIKALTLYAFSTENWLRPENERRVLWKLLKKYLIRDADELHSENIKLRVIGEVDRLDVDVRSVLDPALEKLSKNTGLQLTFALSYGSRREIARATRLFAEDCMAGRALPSAMEDENFLNRYLWTSDLGELGDVDLFIRTSGEQRISNFLLWQSAYAELVFVNKCWPDFHPKDLEAAVTEYSKRERRFGNLMRVPSRVLLENSVAV
ncbi:MAG: polyprenyl diphosphate synthase [Bdellovibrionia bacterium]